MTRSGALPRPPVALAALLAIAAIVGLCWSLTVPPWQSPDEFAHYAYAESLATAFRLPGAPNRNMYSSDEAAAAAAADAAVGSFHPESVPPNWSRSQYDAYLSADTRGVRGRSNGGGATTAAGNPPLYYLIAAAGYLLDPGGTAFGRLYAMRIEGVILLLLTTLGAWLLAGETFGRRRLPQLVTASVVALLPMATFMSTNVNPDALLMTEWTYALWLAARVVNRQAATADVGRLAFVLIAAILTKSTSYALVAPVVLAVVLGLGRRPRESRRRGLRSAAACALIVVVPLATWLALSPSLGGTAISQVSQGGKSFDVGDFLGYLWQFYLPRLWFMKPYRLVPGLPLNTIWIDEGTGDFGWLVVSVPSWMLMIARIALGLISISSLWFAVRLRGRRLALFSVDALCLLSLLVLLHVTEYRQALAVRQSFLQGRYLLPAVSLLALAVGLVVVRLPRAARAPAVALALIGLLAGQAISLATVVHAYYL